MSGWVGQSSQGKTVIHERSSGYSNKVRRGSKFLREVDVNSAES